MIYKFSLIEKILLRLNIIPHPLVDAVSMVLAGRALQVAVRVGIVDALTDAPQPPGRIAATAGVTEQGALVLLDCMEALGYVSKKNDQYAFTPRGRKFLAKDSPTTFYQMMLFSDSVYGSMNHLADSVRNRVTSHKNLRDFTPEVWKEFNHAMLELALTNVEEVTKLVPVSAQAKKLIDLGGSHGLYSIELAKKHPALVAEIMDLEPVKDFSESYIRQHGMQERVKFRTGDFMEDKVGEDYDLVLAFNIIHGETEEANQRLASIAYGALKKGGLYVILDQIKGTSGNTSLSRLLTSSFGLNLFHQAGGRTYSFEEVRQWLGKSGFEHSELKKLRTPGFGVIIGRK